MDAEELQVVLENSQDGEKAPEKPAGEAEKPKESPEIAQLRRELKEERKARRQAEEGMKHWYDRAAGAAQPVAPEPKKEKEEPEPEIDVVEALTNRGQKFLDEYIERKLERKLSKAGFAKAEDIDSKISSTRAEITREAQLYGRYPDLQDDDSEFYQTTLEIYKDLAKDPVMAKAPSLIEAAAKTAARVLGVEPVTAKRTRKAGDDDEEEEETDDRKTRVMRQAGGGRTPRQREPEADPQIERATRSLVDRLRAEGANITVEGVMKRAAKGITVSTRSLPYRSKR
jgi:hypothetical protein